MTSLQPRDTDTLRLMVRVRAKHLRRRRLALSAGAISLVLVIGAVIFALFYLMQSPSPKSVGATNFLAVTESLTGGTTHRTTTVTIPAAAAASTATLPSHPPKSTVTSTTAASSPSTAPTPSTTAPTTITSRATTAAASPGSKVVVIDPGHQGRANYETEPIGPGSSTRKAKVASGTSGVVTGIPESQLVLTIGLKLRDALTTKGIRVVMTRTTQDVNLSNIERAQIANEAKADLFIRIHADGSDNSATRGIHLLYPASIEGWTDDIAEQSYRAAVLAQKALVAATGAVDRGVQARSDITGFNWSDVPVILPEVGFMTNPEEDRLLATEDYQNKIVAGLTNAILTFLGIN